MQYLVILFLVSTSFAVAEEDPFKPEWSTSCSYGSAKFEIIFRSRSGYADEDDQTVTLRWGAEKAVSFPIREALFVPTKFVTDAKNYCKEIGAFDWPGGNILLLISQNDRPTGNILRAVVINAKTGKFIEDGGEVGSFGDFIEILKDNSGYRALLWRKSYQDPNNFGEFNASDWMHISNDDGHIRYYWEINRR
jgi:hypothetical protein